MQNACKILAKYMQNARKKIYKIIAKCTHLYFCCSSLVSRNFVGRRSELLEVFTDNGGLCPARSSALPWGRVSSDNNPPE